MDLALGVQFFPRQHRLLVLHPCVSEVHTVHVVSLDVERVVLIVKLLRVVGVVILLGHCDVHTVSATLALCKDVHHGHLETWALAQSRLLLV